MAKVNVYILTPRFRWRILSLKIARAKEKVTREGCLNLIFLASVWCVGLRC